MILPARRARLPDRSVSRTRVRRWCYHPSFGAVRAPGCAFAPAAVTARLAHEPHRAVPPAHDARVAHPAQEDTNVMLPHVAPGAPRRRSAVALAADLGRRRRRGRPRPPRPPCAPRSPGHDSRRAPDCAATGHSVAGSRTVSIARRATACAASASRAPRPPACATSSRSQRACARAARAAHASATPAHETATAPAVPAALQAIAACESGGNPRAVGGGGSVPRQVPVRLRDLGVRRRLAATRPPRPRPSRTAAPRAVRAAGASPWPVCGG